MRAKSKNVNDYLKEIPEDRKPIIEKLRNLVLAEIPGISETMEYGMPTYSTDEWICAFASQKNYVSVYFQDLELIRKYEKMLGKVNVGKSGIRFNRMDDVDWGTIKNMVKQASR